MKTLGIFEVKNRLSELCEEVSATGGILVITRHGKPLVQIVPCPDSGAGNSVWDTVEECRDLFGPLTDDFELPLRELSANRGDPLA